MLKTPNEIPFGEAIHLVYSSEVMGEMALVIYFLLECPKMGGVQPVFLAQKTLSLAVRTENNIESPFIN